VIQYIQAVSEESFRVNDTTDLQYYTQTGSQTNMRQVVNYYRGSVLRKKPCMQSLNDVTYCFLIIIFRQKRKIKLSECSYFNLTDLYKTNKT
jgi:hypothetical protein